MVAIIPSQDVQQKIRPCLLGVEIARFKYDDFIRILAIVRRYFVLFETA